MKRKFIISLISFILITSCNPKKGLEIRLLNTDLHFIEIYNPLDSINLPQYKNKKEWEKSINKIEVEFTNSTNSKLLLVSRKNILERVFEKPKSITNYYFEIKDNNNEHLKPLYFGIHDFSHRKFLDIEEQLKKDSIAIANTIYNNYDDEKRLNNYTIIEPDESVILNAKLSLPVPIDYDNLFDSNFGIPMQKDNSYKFKLHYILDKTDIEENMPKQILDSLKEHGVVIKNISFSSQEIIVRGKD